jgi:endonuclease/exonuclease/phosphatase family metal-dependent hydrolase
MTRSQYFRVAEWTSVVLFFFQALRVIFSVLFGIIYDGVFEGPFTSWLVISVLLLLIAFLSPIFFSKRLGHHHLSTLAVLTALARVALIINTAEIRYWGAVITLLFGGLYLATALRFIRQFAAISIVAALCLDQLLRVLGHTYDIGLRAWWVPVQIIWALLILMAGIRLRDDLEEEKTNVGLGIVAGLALGCFLFLQTSLLSLPNAIAWWADASYAIIAPLLLLITLIFLIPTLSMRVATALGSKVVVRIFAFAAILLGLMAGYFLKDFLAVVGLLAAHAASMALLFYFLDGLASRAERTGVAVGLALVTLLILNFLNAFAFTYPYTLPALRELGWTIYLAAGILGSLVIFSRFSERGEERVGLPPLALLPMVVVIIVAVIFVWPVQPEDLASTGTIRIATYNIHYGYDDDWHFTLEEMAKTIEENDCDVVAMQEVDTGRMTSYAVDDAYYLARRLKMNVIYLPTVEHLTGIGVLYRGPKALEDSQWLSSLQEQTGIIGVTLGDVSRPLHVYGTWLGLSNEDTIRQTTEALDFIGEQSPAAFGADFNAHYEDPEAEAIRGAGFIDPFTQLGIDPIPNTSPALQPDHRIDFVWVRGLNPVGAWVSESLASDHRLVVVEVDYQP